MNLVTIYSISTVSVHYSAFSLSFSAKVSAFYVLRSLVLLRMYFLDDLHVDSKSGGICDFATQDRFQMSPSTPKNVNK